MDLYFIKATMHGSVYKLSDFYTGSNYKLNPDYKVNVNLKADNLTSIVLPPALTFNPRDFTHVIAPDMDIIYKINRYDYENNNQVKLFLEEDAFISSYHDFITKDIYINRSNSANLFTGLHDIKDIAIKHQANHFSRGVAENYTGLWALFTFQKSDNDITIKTKNLDILPYVEGSGTFSLQDLKAAYPDDDPSVITPFNVDYYLKFARLTNDDLYQCVWINGVLLWSRVQENMPILEHNTPNVLGPMPALAYKNSAIVLTGDVDTINIAFPLDSTVSTLINYNIYDSPGNQNVFTTLPSFYNIDSFGDATDDLLSIKIITEEFIIESDNIVYDSGAQKLLRYYIIGTGTAEEQYITLTPDSYRLKVITNNIYSKLNGGKASENRGQRANSLIINQFKNIFNFDYSSYQGIFNTEPFKKYFISLYGQLVQIPNKYLDNFSVRIAITSSDVLYEVYTDKYNVIASGRLQWFTRYALDQLDLFMANNPTYKEQFSTNQISGAIKNIGLGAVGGSLSAGPGLGTAIGVASSIVTIATNITNLHYMEKGYKDKADEIIGQNDLSMSLLRGYGVYLIEVVPEAVSLNQMIETYNLIGFPCGTKLKPNTIITSGNNVIAGRMLEVVKNNYVTNEINKKLNEGVVVIL